MDPKGRPKGAKRGPKDAWITPRIVQVDILAKVLSLQNYKRNQLEKNISGHWDRLLAQDFDVRLAGRSFNQIGHIWKIPGS